MDKLVNSDFFRGFRSYSTTVGYPLGESKEFIEGWESARKSAQFTNKKGNKSVRDYGGHRG